MIYKGIISRVVPGSLASLAGLVVGDKLITVNNQQIKDIIDLSFALADEAVELFVEKTNGEQKVLEIKKEYDEDLGIEFESAVFDYVHPCANKCIFCFVDQMPPGFRESLYVKDDDYRLSFLYGNFVTLTNVTSKDINRIKRLHLSPLYVSVHTTDAPLRGEMLGIHHAADIMKQLKALINNGIEFHTQVVLCPHINDGEALEKTIRDLYSLFPGILSLAIVPVGLTRYRDDCHPLTVFTSDVAQQVVDRVEKWQTQCRKDRGTSFVYLADEFYLLAKRPIPAEAMYDGFPQLENGVGLIRNFLSEWSKEPIVTASGYGEPQYLDVICGISAETIIGPLLAPINIPNLTIRVIPVKNQFFGPHITVTGLLTGQDIISTLSALPGPRTGIIIPGVALRKGQDIFLDNTTPDDIAEALAVPVRKAYFPQELLQLLREWK